MENNKGHKITLPCGNIGFSSLDVPDQENSKYKILSPYDLVDAIIVTDEPHMDCLFLQSTNTA